jgi:hypothetical protein
VPRAAAFNEAKAGETAALDDFAFQDENSDAESEAPMETEETPELSDIDMLVLREKK